MADATFQRLEEDGKSRIGPSAVLLCGFAIEEADGVSRLLEQVEASAHRVVFCAEPMLGQTLAEALASECVGLPLPPEKLPRVMILSGLRSGQIRALVGNFEPTGLARPIFASVTPANLGFPLRQLLRALLREQAAVSRGPAEPSRPQAGRHPSDEEG